MAEYRNPKRLRPGLYNGQPGIYWGWLIDGYYDLHHAPEGVAPDGSDVIGEGYGTLSEVRKAAKEMAAIEEMLA